MLGAPCANATGAPSNRAAIATEYFNILFSYAESTFPVVVGRNLLNIPDVPCNRRYAD
jgi:hypothetical protein